MDKRELTFITMREMALL
ncbi:hypothetical protein YQE_00446, partial [Dendroctonus ponderosae]